MASGTFGKYVVMKPAAIQKLLTSPDGPVARDLMIRGNRVKARAQQLVGVYRPHSAVPRARKPGTLRDSIVTRYANTGGKLRVIVGSHDPIALWHHEGTVPHTIVPVRAKRLRFGTRQDRLPARTQGPVREAGVVYAKRVQHPGTQPNRFLVDALPAARR